MIKSVQQLQKEGWQQICTDIWMLNHKENHYLFYNTKTYALAEHIWTKSFAKNLTDWIRNGMGLGMTKAKFFKTHGDEKGKMLILIDMAKLYTKEPHIYYSTENGKKVYCRNMITIDPDYHNGMKAVAEIQTEKIIGRNFDNVTSVLLSKGLISHTLDKKWLREEKLERVMDETPKEIKKEVIEQNFPLEEIVNQIQEEHNEKISGKFTSSKWSIQEINKAKSEVLAEKGTCTIADIKAKLK